MKYILDFFIIIFLSSFVLSQNSSSIIQEPDVVEEPSPVLCVPGSNLGYALIRKPNITSILTVGTQYNISWDWSVSVTKPPTYVDIYVQLIASGIKVTWKKIILEKQPAQPTWALWKVNGLTDGKYKIRIVADGKETFNIPANLMPCYSNGESIPSVSSSFIVANVRDDIGVSPDAFPPNSSVEKKMFKRHICILFIIFEFLNLYIM